ncbi:hypothetical protein H4684_003465 [Desulfomicrobium macestii]|uniref:Uncharacterized protein n=1 Tax=Desulfomicrobium macestii TaxID=90731 RepID=A0ABR9H7V1_9BACT|nr:hypothetical protein [Desulfomicrobium macestii]
MDEVAYLPDKQRKELFAETSAATIIHPVCSALASSSARETHLAHPALALQDVRS